MITPFCRRRCRRATQCDLSSLKLISSQWAARLLRLGVDVVRVSRSCDLFFSVEVELCLMLEASCRCRLLLSRIHSVFACERTLYNVKWVVRVLEWPLRFFIFIKAAMLYQSGRRPHWRPNLVSFPCWGSPLLFASDWLLLGYSAEFEDVSPSVYLCTKRRMPFFFKKK